MIVLHFLLYPSTSLPFDYAQGRFDQDERRGEIT